MKMDLRKIITMESGNRSGKPSCFAFAGILKLGSIRELSDVIRSVLPGSSLISGGLAIAIILSELVTSALLLFKRTRALGAVLCLALATLFLIVNLFRFFFGISVPCSCFGSIYTAGPLQMATLDIVIGSIAYLLLHKLKPQVVWL